MLGSERRSFHAAMAVKYCEGNARRAEVVFGWNRHTVELGLNERRTGVVCLGAQSLCNGNKLWEEKHPEVARALWDMAELALPTRSDLSYYAFIHPIDGGRRAEAFGRLGFCSRMLAVAQHDGKRTEP